MRTSQQHLDPVLHQLRQQVTPANDGDPELTRCDELGVVLRDSCKRRDDNVWTFAGEGEVVGGVTVGDHGSHGTQCENDAGGFSIRSRNDRSSRQQDAGEPTHSCTADADHVYAVEIHLFALPKAPCLSDYPLGDVIGGMAQGALARRLLHRF